MSATRYYRSKIGRLPFAIRTELNERIRDGATGPVILGWLNGTPEMTAVRAETGCADLNAQNLTDWRNTGYADWLDEQDKTERLRSMASLSQSIVAQTGGDPAAVGARILTAKLLDALEEANPVTQGELVKAFSSLRAGENDARRTELAGEKQQIDKERLALDRQKFQSQTVTSFMKKWYSDDRIRAVMENKTLDNDAQTAALGKLMFGELWDDPPKKQ